MEDEKISLKLLCLKHKVFQKNSDKKNMVRKICFALFLFSGCVHGPNLAPPEDSSQRDPAFFELFSVSRHFRPPPPAPAEKNAPSPFPAPPSTLTETDIREMALFYDRWAFQFRQAVQNYKSAANEYKQAARHFKKMSGYTKKKQDRLFFERFRKVEKNLRAADAFLDRAEKLRTTRPGLSRSGAAIR